jgi:hypothetical protein
MALAARSEDDEYRVYTDHPRLILTAQRLRLLKRERERDSQRWRQFDALVKGAASLPEPGFALALYYAVAEDASAGKRAVAWALGPGNDLRQLALVYDWCQPVLSAKESGALAAKIRRLIEKPAGSGIAARRDRVIALIATADDPGHSEEAPLRELVRQWWRMEYAPALDGGRIALALPDLYPLLEILHAMRDNLMIDLRDQAPNYFAHVAKYLVMGNYPAPYRAPENEFRIPMDAAGMDSSNAQPDLNRASLATSLGAPYEFLWANPYQPGLSYFQLPLLFHDASTGALFVRSSWEEAADWFGLLDGQAEFFHAGRVTVVDRSASGSAAPKPLELGETSVIFGRAPFQFSTEGGTVLAIGLEKQHTYLVETDDEEMREAEADRAGTLVLEYPSGRTAGVRVHAGPT